MNDDIESIQKLINTMIDFLVNYSFQAIGAILVFVIGLVAARYVGAFLFKTLEKRQFDITLSKFMSSAVKGTILGFAVMVALGKFGITIAPLVAALAAMAFGASFAIQGPLSNYGAGLAIVLTRPFIVGNTITVAGVSGVVEEVKLGATILEDEDGVKITIPNKHIIGEILHNSQEYKIVEEVVGVSYAADPEAAIGIIKECLHRFPELSGDPEPQVGIQAFGDSAIHIGLRYWIPTKQYYRIRYKTNLAIYRGLKEGNIEIPFPQREVRIVSTA